MADPSWAAVAEMYAFFADNADELEKHYSTATTGLDARIEALRNDLEGDYAQATRSGLEGRRVLASSLLERGGLRVLSDPIVRQWVSASAVDSSGDPDRDFLEVYDYMISNVQTVNSRGWTFGAYAADGGNVGNATVARLTVDEEGHVMEAWWPDVYTLECREDYLTLGREHTALFRLRGRAPNVDSIGFSNSGLLEEGIEQLSDLQSSGRVANPSFDNGSFSGATITTLTNWTIAGSNAETNTTATYIYLDTTNGGTPRSLRFTGDETVSQELQTQSGLRLDDDTPYMVGAWVYRRDSCDGTLTLRLANGLSGGVSRDVTVTTLSNGAWNWVTLVATPGANNWPKGFRAQDLTLSFKLASRTTGSLYFDTVVFAPWTRVGSRGQARRGRGSMGQYLAVIAGSTQTKRGDLWTATDTEGTRAVNQFWTGPHGAGYGYLPSDNAAGETVADK